MTSSLLRNAADVRQADSFSNKMRSRRFKAFESLVGGLDFNADNPLKILDVGGTETYWEQRGWADREDVRITMVNLEAAETRHPHLTIVAGDATKLEYADGEFDVVHSNSVIEHLFTKDNQEKMATEVRRVGRCYWVQTPNHWFPVEPHFRAIGWQYLPRWVRIGYCALRGRCGRGGVASLQQAKDLVNEIRLLDGGEMREMFPDARLLREKYRGLTKSFVAIRGFPGNDTVQL